MNYLFSDKVKDMQPSAIREIFKSLSDPNMISFAAGPAAASFPVEKIRAISEQILRLTTRKNVCYTFRRA